MSINIPGRIAAISEVTAVVHIDKLGPRQQVSLRAMVRSGIVKGYSIPAQLARQILETARSPFINYMNRGYCRWRNIPLNPEHPLRKALIEAHGLSVLNEQYEDTPYWGEKGRGFGWRVRKGIGDENLTWVYFTAEAVKMFKAVSMEYDFPVGDVVEIKYK